MLKKVYASITVTLLVMMVLSTSVFGAFNGYALRFNNQAILDKLTPTNTTLTLKEGYTSFISTAHDPNASYTFGEEDALDADTYKFMVIRYKTNCKHNVGSTIGEMYFASDSSGYDPNKTRITWNLNTEDQWSSAIVDLSGNADWKGNLKSLRIDYLEGSALPADQTMDIEYIAVFATKAEAEAFDGNFDANPATGDESFMLLMVTLVALGAVVLKKKLAY